MAADATDVGRLTALARGAVAHYNCANPPYDEWLTAWPPLASSLLTAAESWGRSATTFTRPFVLLAGRAGDVRVGAHAS